MAHLSHEFDVFVLRLLFHIGKVSAKQQPTTTMKKKKLFVQAAAKCIVSKIIIRQASHVAVPSSSLSRARERKSEGETEKMQAKKSIWLTLVV